MILSDTAALPGLSYLHWHTRLSSLVTLATDVPINHSRSSWSNFVSYSDPARKQGKEINFYKLHQTWSQQPLCFENV